MRVSSFIATLFVATNALPLPATHTPLLKDLPDTLLDIVGDLLGYPERPHKDVFQCSDDPGACYDDCTAQCVAGGPGCGTCFQGCYQNLCSYHHRDGKHEDNRDDDDEDNDDRNDGDDENEDDREDENNRKANKQTRDVNPDDGGI